MAASVRRRCLFARMPIMNSATLRLYSIICLAPFAFCKVPLQDYFSCDVTRESEDGLSWDMSNERCRLPRSSGGLGRPHGQRRGGNLTVTVLEATNLVDEDWWGEGAGDSDAKIEIGVRSYHTRIALDTFSPAKERWTNRTSTSVKDSLNPVWPNGGEKLSFGSQTSGDLMVIKVWDADSGLEFYDDLLFETEMNVPDCSCFTSDDEFGACTKGECVEEAWLPLWSEERGIKPVFDERMRTLINPCRGREHWPWGPEADVNAPCLRIRVSITPFRLRLVETGSPSSLNASFTVTTASVQNSLDSRTVAKGSWGRAYDEPNFRLNDKHTPFWDDKHGPAGGLMMQMPTLGKDFRKCGAQCSDYSDDPVRKDMMFTIETNMDSYIWVYRKYQDYGWDGCSPLGEDAYCDSHTPYGARPDWLRPDFEPGLNLDDDNVSVPWFEVTPTILQAGIADETTSRYKAVIANATANEPFILGWPANKAIDARGNPWQPQPWSAMYIVIATFVPDFDRTEYVYRTFFESTMFFGVMWEMFFVELFFVAMLWPFMSKIRWRLGRVESYLMQEATRGAEGNLVALVLREAYGNGSKQNIDFRRALYWTSWGVWAVVLVVPITLLNYGLIATATAIPPYAGLAVTLLGLAAMFATIASFRWQNGGWRMTGGILKIFMAAFTSIFLFLLGSVFSDMRVWDAGMERSLFCLTCVAFTANLLPMIWQLFISDERLSGNFAQLHKVIEKNQKVASIKNKFKAMGAMGLKLAMKRTAQGDGGRKKIKAFGSLLGSAFSIDDTMKEFRFTDVLMSLFAKSSRVRERVAYMWYLLSVIILLFYSILVQEFCPSFAMQGWGLSFAVLVLDSSVYLLRRGPCTWGTANYVTLSFLGRVAIASTAGEWWIVGVSAAYFIYGLDLGTEIINQRMRTLSKDRAGAVAYFGKADEPRKNPYDVSASPEFVLGYLSFVFLCTCLAYVFAVESEDMPTVPMLGQEWKVYVFCLAAFVVVIVAAVFGMAKRAMLLQAKDLLTSEVFFYWEWWDLPLQLIALAELLLVCSGLLFYAMTGSRFVFVTACILPLILGTGVQVLSQWIANDYKLLEPVEARLEEDSDEDEDEDEDGEQGAGEATKSPGASLFGSIKSAVSGNQDGDSGISLPPLTKTAGSIGKKIAMPALPFRSPVKKAKKKDRSGADAEESGGDGENPTEATALLSESKSSPSGASNPFALAASQGSGEGGSGFSNPFAKAAASGNEGEENEDGEEGEEGEEEEEEEELEEGAPLLARVRYDMRRRIWFLTKRGRDARHAAWKEYLGLDEENWDPTKMTDEEAFLKGGLTSTDYATLRNMCLCFIFIIAYGEIVSAMEDPAWWGYLAWLLACLLITSLMPTIKYIQIYEVTEDMQLSLFIFVLLELIGCGFFFEEALANDVNEELSLWLLVCMVYYPLTLIFYIIFETWRDDDWRLSKFTLRTMKFFVGAYFFLVFLLYVYVGPRIGTLALLVWGMCFGIFELIQAWARYGHYLPKAYQHWMSFVLGCIALAFIAYGVLFAENADLFFCLTIAFFCLVTRFLARAAGDYASVPSGTPLYFSPFVFPVYSYEPRSGEITQQNSIFICIYLAFFSIIVWGVVCVVLIDPLDVGVGIISFTLIALVSYTIWLISLTPNRIAEATLCIDAAELKETAATARKSFDRRRKNFEVRNAEWDKADADEEAMQKQLNRYSNWNKPKKVKLIEFEQRFSAGEMVTKVHAAEHRLHEDRNGNRRKDGPLSFFDALADAWYTGGGPLGLFTLGGIPYALYEEFHPNHHRRSKSKVYAAGGEEKVLDGSGINDMMDRLVDVLGPGGDELEVVVKDYDVSSLDDTLGKVYIPLEDLEANKPLTQDDPDHPETFGVGIWYPLLDKREEKGGKPVLGKNGEPSEVQITVECRDPWKDLRLKVTVHAARNLRAADIGGTSDPYVMLKAGEYTNRTLVVKKSLDPDWSDTKGCGKFNFPPVDDTLIIDVKDADLATSDHLGTAMVPLVGLDSESEITAWYPLEGGEGKKLATGEIEVTVLLSTECGENGLVASDACLTVTVIKARGLRAADRGGTSDPFCLCRCGKEVFRTSTIKKTLDPEWDEEYTFNEDEDDDDDEDPSAEQIEKLDAFKVYAMLPKLDVGLDREFFEEMRAVVHFQFMLIVVSAARLSKEAILFQRFLKENRFKLLANGVEPPEDIFRSKSFATVDVQVVALWLIHLTPEQRERFHQLKHRFTAEVEEGFQTRMQQDKMLHEHSEQLLAWLAQHDYQMALKRWEMFQARRQRRLENDNDEKSPKNPNFGIPEDVINANEMLEEIAGGKFCEPGPGGEGGRRHQFHDPEFPPNNTIVAGCAGESMVMDWRVASGINENAKLFKGGTDPDDVFQGILHNGWFLSAISILAASGGVDDEEVDPLIDNLFITKSISESGAYAVRLYKNSQWEAVIVDDHFAVLDDAYKMSKCGGAAFAYASGFEEIWVSILEKAYAKYYGGYRMLENGYVHHALTSFTGAMSEEIFLVTESRGSAKPRLWEKMVRYMQNGFLMGCGTISNDSANAEQLESGLVFGSCYVIYEVRSVDGKNLLKLRNPPGDHGEWQGDWSDNSECWTRRLRRKLDWEDRDDGTFWMSFDDFCLAFRNLYVCHYYHPEQWQTVKDQSRWSGDGRIVELEAKIASPDPKLGKEEQDMEQRAMEKEIAFLRRSPTAAGLPCKHNLACKLRNNPQWTLDIQRPTDVHIKVTQTFDGVASTTLQPFSFLLVRGGRSLKKTKRVNRLSTNTIVEWTGDPSRELEKHIRCTLQPHCYVLLIATYGAGLEGPFEIQIDTAFPCKVKQLWPPEGLDGQYDESDEYKDDDEDEPSTRLGRMKKKMEQKKKEALAKVEQHVGPLDELTGQLNEALGGEGDASLEDGADLGAAAKETAHAVANAGVTHARAAAAKVDTAALAAVNNAVLPDENWVEQFDPNSGMPYYWHKVSNETVWERPASFQPGGRSEEMDAASKIQAGFRGKKARKKVSLLQQ